MSSKPKKDKSRNKTTKDKSEGDEPKPHIVLAGKRKIMGVDDVTDEEEYNTVEDMTPMGRKRKGLRDPPGPILDTLRSFSNLLCSHFKSTFFALWINNQKKIFL